MRTAKTLAVILAAALPAAGHAATLYKTPQCGCCEAHAEHLRRNGIAVRSVDAADPDRLRREHGVPDDLAGCHTLVLGGYAVEGHVPAAVIKRLLVERPAVRGISLPGMPIGSPGMDSPRSEPLVIRSFGGSGGPAVFDVR